MLAIFLAVVVLYAWRAPSSWVGRLVHAQVETACRRRSRVKPSTVVLSLILIAALGALAAYAKMEGLMVAGHAAAELRPWLALIDVGAYAEVLAAAWLLRPGSSGVRAVIQGLQTARLAIARRIGRARRAIRVHGTRRPRRGAGEDDEPAVWGFPLAAT